jgi:protein MAK16
MWEKVKLKKNMVEAVEQINVHLMHWDDFVRQKCKARLVRIHQYLLRMRKMELRGRLVNLDIQKFLFRQQKIIPIGRKAERKEVRKEEKALAAAKLENAIEKELLNRLKQGTYGDIYNFNPQVFERVLDQQEVEEEVEVCDSVCFRNSCFRKDQYMSKTSKNQMKEVTSKILWRKKSNMSVRETFNFLFFACYC